jgi:two-component system sensor histidine kinase BaeS
VPVGISVFGDPDRLRQLFGNLLDNSLKYTDPGGELNIKAWKDGERVMIDFQDSAPGVPEADLEKLFERLYRVESSRSRATGGAGLGLAICHNIVEAHEGSIIAKPSPLGGVWIRVEMPCYGIL